MQLNWLQVVKADATTATPATTARSSATSPARAAPSSPPTAWSSPAACRRTTATSCQREYPTGDLFAGVGGYFSFVYGTDGVERQYNDVLAGQTPQQKLRGFANLFNDDVNTGDVHAHVAQRHPAVAQQALGDKEGSRRGVRSPHRRHPRHVELTRRYDPNTIATHDFNAAKAARDASAGRPGQAAAA